MRGVLCKYNSKREEKIGHQTHVFCNKKKEWIPVYKCGKQHCAEHEFYASVLVAIPVGRCDECPYHTTKATPGAGFADDYYCKKTGKIITTYVEWDSEIPPVPDWCPYREKEVIK